MKATQLIAQRLPPSSGLAKLTRIGLLTRVGLSGPDRRGTFEAASAGHVFHLDRGTRQRCLRRAIAPATVRVGDLNEALVRPSYANSWSGAFAL
jgi:hypothetical protein